MILSSGLSSLGLKRVPYISSFKLKILSEPNNSLNLSKISVDTSCIFLNIKDSSLIILNKTAPGLNTNCGRAFSSLLGLS